MSSRFSHDSLSAPTNKTPKLYPNLAFARLESQFHFLKTDSSKYTTILKDLDANILESD